MTARNQFLALVLFLLPAGARASDPNPPYTVTEDVVYGRRDGLALTMDVIVPKKSNGRGVILFVSAEYRSGRDLMALVHPLASEPFLERGYTVFAAMHGSQPKYTVPEIVEDAHRAVRFVRYSAKKYGIDPDKLGATGGSAGGHLALMVGCAGRPGNPGAKDLVERERSGVQAVSCFFPPTDFLALEDKATGAFAALFDIREFDPKTGRYERVSVERRREVGRAVSPLTHAGKGSAPVFVVHGDQDPVVPIEQSKALVAKLTACGVACELSVKKDKRHFWVGIEKDVTALADWFDKHLAPEK
jgi:acetyl esterase/lipase